MNKVSPLFNYISTPWGNAIQEITQKAFDAKQYVQNGGLLYKIGKSGVSETGMSQFWATINPLENPLEFAKQYQVPLKNIENADFVIVGRMSPDANFITRTAADAPGALPTTTRAQEVVADPGSVIIESYHAGVKINFYKQ